MSIRYSFNCPPEEQARLNRDLLTVRDLPPDLDWTQGSLYEQLTGNGFALVVTCRPYKIKDGQEWGIDVTGQIGGWQVIMVPDGDGFRVVRLKSVLGIEQSAGAVKREAREIKRSQPKENKDGKQFLVDQMTNTLVEQESQPEWTGTSSTTSTAA